MARRGLKNVRREKSSYLGQASWKLSTVDQAPIPAFEHFCGQMVGYSYRTRKRYAEALSRFIDFLFEAKVFREAVTAAHLNSVIAAYPLLLRDGSEVVAARVRKSGADLWLAEVAEGLDWAPIMPASFSNTLAPVNKFLRISEGLALEARERAQLLGHAVHDGPVAIIEVVDGRTRLSGHEVAAMRQNSMFGSVAKFAPKGIERAKGISSQAAGKKSQDSDRDFPREFFAPLIRNATTWRDKCLWLLMGAAGLRGSEALNTHRDDIDMERQRVYVFDPLVRRARPSDEDPNRSKFKGRTCAITFLIPELRRELFYALQKYLELEYVPCYRPGEANYLFQYVEPARRGLPYVDASDETLRKNFDRAARLGNVPLTPNGEKFVRHSLRHMYGVYWVNDFPVNPKAGLFGLPLTDVQLMMGHSKIATTAKYARSKRRRIEEKLHFSDMEMLAMTEQELRSLPGFRLSLGEHGL